MITTIARKEFTEMWRDGRFRLANAIVFVLLITAILLGWHHERLVQQERDAAQNISRQQWLDQPAMNPHSAAHYSIFAFKPAAPLALADTGIDPYAGVAVWLEAHNQNEAIYSTARDATGAMRFGQLTAALVMQLLVPLVIIMLSFSALAGERETGTLRQTMGQGVSRTSLIFGKVFGVGVALGTVLLPAAVIGSLAVMLGNGESLADSGLRFTALAASYFAYFLIFVAISLAVSAISRTARTALIVLLVFWGLNLVLPRAATDIARHLYKTPTALEFQAAVSRDMREGIDGHNPYDKRAEELKERLLKQYNVKSIEELPVNFSGISLQEGEEYGDRVNEKHYGALWQSYKRQNTVHTLAALFAPLAAIRPVSMGMAGSDWNHHLHFATSAEEYRRMLVKHMNEDLTYNSISQDYEKNVKGRELYEQVPDFQYTPPGFGWIAGKLFLPFGLLSMWLMLSLAVLFLSAGRMSVDAVEES